MKRVFAVLACGSLLSACGSTNWSMPSMDMSAFKTAPATTSVRVESEPAGAEAKAPTGPGCRTPCTLPLAANGTTVVSFSLQGYLPHSIPVTVSSSRESGDLPDSGAAESTRVDPSPVFAALEVAPPPPPPPRKKAPPPKAKPRPKPAPAAQAAPPPPPPQQQQQPGFGPPAGAPPPSVFR
jgi:hypothetical protein